MTEADGEWPALACLQAGPEGEPIRPGRVVGGRRALRLSGGGAGRDAGKGRAHAGIVTAPLNKEALNKAGYHYAGHTEMLADARPVRSGSVMMLAHGNMRVSHVTHACRAGGRAEAADAGAAAPTSSTLTARGAAPACGLPRRRIAVAALNPHAGEGGLFGREDIDGQHADHRRSASREGLDVVGPVPGDTVFVKLRARAVRRRGRDVPRPGAHPGQAARLHRRSGNRHAGRR